MSNGPYIVDETCLVFAKNIEEENERLRAENAKFFKQAEMNARLLTENAELRERLAEADEANRRVSDENQRIRQAIKEYLSNLARVTNDMLQVTWKKEVGDE